MSGWEEKGRERAAGGGDMTERWRSTVWERDWERKKKVTPWLTVRQAPPPDTIHPGYALKSKPRKMTNTFIHRSKTPTLKCIYFWRLWRKKKYSLENPIYTQRHNTVYKYWSLLILDSEWSCEYEWDERERQKRKKKLLRMLFLLFLRMQNVKYELKVAE